MTTSKEHIEEMHARLTDIANREQLLINALNLALSSADRRLLDDVRSVTLEHEARRAVILTELQSLAARIGAFPMSDEPVEKLEHKTNDLPHYMPSETSEANQTPMKGGDWRQAAENISSEFDFLTENESSSVQNPNYSPKTAA